MTIVQSSALEVSDLDGQLVVDSRLIADRLGIEHDTLFKTIEKYSDRLSSQSEIRFKIEFRERPQGGKSKVRYAFLDERQATLLMTYSRNTEQVLDCKDALVDAFDRAKQIIKTVIPAQGDRIRELELEVELAKLNSNAVSTASLLVALHGEALGLTIAGLSTGQVIEIRIPTTEVLNPVTGECKEFLSAKQLADEVKRRTGQNIKNADFIRKLKAANRDDLILPMTRNMTCEYVTEDNLNEAMKVVFGSSRQTLLQPVKQATGITVVSSVTTDRVGN